MNSFIDWFICLCCIVFWDVSESIWPPSTHHKYAKLRMYHVGIYALLVRLITYTTHLFKTRLIYIVGLGHNSWLRVIYLHFEPDSLGECSGARQVMVTTETHLVFKWREESKHHCTRVTASEMFNVLNAQIGSSVQQQQTWFFSYYH